MLIANIFVDFTAATTTSASTEPRELLSFGSVASAFPGLPLHDPQLTTGSVRTAAAADDDAEFAK